MTASVLMPRPINRMATSRENLSDEFTGLGSIDAFFESVTSGVKFEETEAQSTFREFFKHVETLAERPIKWSTQIFDLGEEGYRLSTPIQIIIEEYDDDSVVARFPEVNTFGEGECEQEAIINLKYALLDLYDELMTADPESLGRLPRVWCRVLNGLVLKD